VLTRQVIWCDVAVWTTYFPSMRALFSGLWRGAVSLPSGILRSSSSVMASMPTGRWSSENHE
jgi:hypothetical protein